MLRPFKEVRVAGADTSNGPARADGWSRRRGVLAAVVAVLAVLLTLVLSRLDLANEVAVVRSQLTAANQELAENERELDELEDEARARSESVAACRDSAELGEQIRQALDLLQRGLDRGDEGMIARGVATFQEQQQEWSEANDRCLQATREAEGG
jgi:hypothetical protein